MRHSPLTDALLRLGYTALVFMLLFVAQRSLFMAIYAGTIGGAAIDVLEANLHGAAMDCAVTAYLMVIPVILAIASVWTGRRWVTVAWNIYSWATALLLAAIFTLDTILYGYWGFRLDMTPVFYFATSPPAAMASASWPEAICGVAALIALTIAIYLLVSAGARLIPIQAGGRPWIPTAVLTLCGALLFLAMRGGVTVSTMNPSRAYYSSNPRLNHSALNPAFSLLYSAAHQDDFGSRFNFYNSDEAERLAGGMKGGGTTADRDTTLTLTTERPDIYLVILESFSSHLLPSTRGEPIALKLDSIAASGAMWTRFYACSFRTDRALPAILSALPSQPTASLMKFVDKAEKLPSLAAELKRQGGYETAYYYGGDANFTNMMAYLVSGGYDRIVSDKDFPLSEKMSKWGAHDHVVMQRVVRERPAGGDKPRFTVVQTSSSHEPFEVPYSNPRFASNDRANSLAYTDSCLAVMADALTHDPARPALLVIVPDHYGTWPRPGTLEPMTARHHIPLVMAGNALTGHGRFDTVGSQPDIAHTLLGLLGLDASAFPFGNDLLDRRASHYAWLTEPELVCLIGSDGTTATYNIAAKRPEPKSDPAMTERAKAFLQHLYTYIASL